MFIASAMIIDRRRSLFIDFIALHQISLNLILLLPRSWLVRSGRSHGLGEREQPDHQRGCDMGWINGCPSILPHDHHHASIGTRNLQLALEALWWSLCSDICPSCCSTGHPTLHGHRLVWGHSQALGASL